MSTEEEVLRVVFVEDDEASAEMYTMRLEQDGYRVAVAADGQAGLELIRSMVPDLVYLDLRLPKLDGLEVLRSLRADHLTRGVPVVVLSNYDEPELQRQGLELGILEWLIKANVTPAALAERTAELMRMAEEAEAWGPSPRPDTGEPTD